VGSGAEPIVLRTDGVANATPSWSPDGQFITWETDHGLVLALADGQDGRHLSDDQWLVHAWSKDGSEIFGIRETEQLRLLLFAVNARTGRERSIADLGPSPPVNNAVKGMSVSADGRTIATSIVRLRGDLWVLENLPAPRPWTAWFPHLRFR
jgi:Tol biopolymer transport system component